MNCRQARRLIDAQLNRPRAPLPADERDRLRAHLAGCDGCARFARALDQGLPALKRLPTVPPDPRALAMFYQLPTRWWEQPAILRLRWWAGRAIAFAGAMLLIVLVTGLLTTLDRLRPQQPATAADTPVPAMAGSPPEVGCAVDDPAVDKVPQAADEKALQQAIFAAAASTLGLTPEQLKAEFAAGRTLDELAAQRNLTGTQVQAASIAAGRAYLVEAVQRGTLSQAEADKWSQVLPDLVAKLMPSQGPKVLPGTAVSPKDPPSPQPGTALDALHDAVLAAAAGQLGLTPDQLMTELTTGATINALAQARGVALDQIREAMRVAGQTSIDNGTANGALSADEAANLATILPMLIDKLTFMPDPTKPAANVAPCARGTPSVPAVAMNMTGTIDALQAGAAVALGLSPEELRLELAAGKSIAGLTQERSGDPAQVKAAMQRAATEYLVGAVQRGELTQAEANELTSDLSHLVEKVFLVGEKQAGATAKPSEKNPSPPTTAR